MTLTHYALMCEWNNQTCYSGSCFIKVSENFYQICRDIEFSIDIKPNKTNKIYLIEYTGAVRHSNHGYNIITSFDILISDKDINQQNQIDVSSIAHNTKYDISFSLTKYEENLTYIYVISNPCLSITP